VKQEQESIFSLTNHEIYVLTARAGENENGQIATWIMPATLARDSARIVAVLSQQNSTWSLIEQSGRFVLTMLAEDQHALLPLFGLYSGRDINKFEGVSTGRTPSALPYIEGGCGWAECVVIDGIDAGDRMILLADVVDQHHSAGKTPLRREDAFGRQSEDIREKLEEKKRLDGERDGLLIKRLETFRFPGRRID